MEQPKVDLRFTPPPLPPHHVSRPRLLAALDDAEPAALTLVAAGPGAGKTVLLGEWATRQVHPVLWLALTREDDEPGRFWPLFLEGGRAQGQVYPASSWSSGRTVELLDWVLGRGPLDQPRLTVVLDDAHELKDPGILDGLDRIVRRWSARARLVLAARSDPLLPLHRYRLAGQLCEIRAAQLAMTVPEAGELLDRHGLSLPAEDITTLITRTEGWTAGLTLAALHMEGTSGRPELPVTGQGSIGEYLTEEVLSVQPEPVRRLLVETSFLDEVTGPLADAVTGLGHSAAALSRLARTNAFVTPLDEERTAFRYHQLFREILRYLADADPPEVVQGRYARAASWYQAKGDLSNALRWMVRSRDAGSALSLLVRGGLAEALVRDQDLTRIGLDRVVAGSPSGATPAEPMELAVVRWAVTAATVTDPERAGGELDQLPVLGIELARAAPDVRVAAAVSQLILGLKAGDHDLVDVAANELLGDGELAGTVRETPGLRAAALFARARSRFSSGRFEDVEPLLRQTLAEVADSESPALELAALSVLAFFAATSGRVRLADETLRLAEDLLVKRRSELKRTVLLDLAMASRAELAADWPALAAAVRRALAAGPIYADYGIAFAVTHYHAVSLVAAGEPGQAATLLRHNHTIEASTDPQHRAVRDRDLAGIELSLGRPRAALKLVEPYQNGPFAPLMGVTIARAHLALDDPGEAEECLRTLLSSPDPRVNTLMTIEALLCQAEVAFHSGDGGQAAELADCALQLADGGLVVPFVQSAARLGPLLARHPALAERWPVPVPGEAADHDQMGSAARLNHAAPLTAREWTVLRLMVTTMSTAEMARALYISISTVKTHLASIYRKLGAAGRRDAVSRARTLELL